MAGYWIDPKGKVFDVPHFMHETFARSRGATSISELIRRGWIRTIDSAGAFNFQISTYQDSHSLELIEDFLVEHSRAYERWAATIETENPLEPPAHLMDRDIHALGLKDAIAREVRLHRLKPFGMMGDADPERELEFYGEFESVITTSRGTKRTIERFWYDPETDDIVCERMIA